MSVRDMMINSFTYLMKTRAWFDIPEQALDLAERDFALWMCADVCLKTHLFDAFWTHVRSQ